MKEKFFEKVAINVTSNILVGALTALSSVIIIILISIYEPLKIMISQYVSNSLLVATIIILFTLLAITVVVIIFLYSKTKNPNRDYLVGMKGGLIKHKESGILFCPICFSNNILSPLYDTMGYVCHKCNKRLPRVQDEKYVPFPKLLKSNS